MESEPNGIIVDVISVRQETAYEVQPESPPGTSTIIVYAQDVGTGLLHQGDRVEIPQQNN